MADIKTPTKVEAWKDSTGRLWPTEHSARVAELSNEQQSISSDINSETRTCAYYSAEWLLRFRERIERYFELEDLKEVAEWSN